MTVPPRARAMLAARAKDSHNKRQRALAALHSLEAAGTPVSATAVAAAAGVSTGSPATMRRACHRGQPAH